MKFLRNRPIITINENKTYIKGEKDDLLTLFAILVSHLKKVGIEKEEIEFAFKIGLEKSED